MSSVSAQSKSKDSDSDGIADDLDLSPNQYDAPIELKGADYTLSVLASGRIANLVLDQQIVSDMAKGNSYDRLPDLSRKIYEQFYDRFDFLIFISDQDSLAPGTYFGRYFTVRNSVEGIGQSPIDEGARYGSDRTGALKGIVHLTRSDGLKGPVLHEIMHQWGNYLESIPASVAGHWGFSSAGGQLGGWKRGTFSDSGNGRYVANNGVSQFFGTFANGGNGVPYGEIELYLMGLIPVEEVSSIQIAENAEFLGVGYFKATGIRTVAPSEIVGIDGERFPDHLHSQKDFRALTVVLSQARLPVERWVEYDKDAYQLSRTGNDDQSLFNFWEATGGSASLRMDGLVQLLKSKASVDDTTGPTVRKMTYRLPRTTCGPVELIVTYDDDSAINLSTLGHQNIKVAGPNGFNQAARLLKVASSSGYPPVTAMYILENQLGGWSVADNGEYTISIAGDKVADNHTKFVQPQIVGAFNWGFSNSTNQVMPCFAAKSWEFDLGAPVETSPALGDDNTVYVAVASGLYALDGLKGTLKWKRGEGGSYKSSPSVAKDGTIYIGSSGAPDELVAFDGKNGAIKWTFGTAGSIRTTPAIGRNGTVFFGTQEKHENGQWVTDGKLYALDGSKGKKLWEFEAGANILSSPAIGADETVYFGTHFRRDNSGFRPDGKLYALDGRTGSNRWVFKTDGVGGIICSPGIGADGTVYFASQYGVVYAIDGATGTERWKFKANASFQDSSPAIGPDGTLYIGGLGPSFDGTLYAIDTLTGTRKWAFKTSGRIESSPAIGADGAIYVGSLDGKLWALEASTGQKRWEFRVDGGVFSSPVIGRDGTIYFGSGRRYEGTREIIDTKLFALRGSSVDGLASSAWPMKGQNAQHTGRAINLAPTAKFVVKESKVTPQGMQLKIEATSAVRLLLQRSDDLKSWTDLSTINIDAGSISVTVPALARESFYRAMILP